jgi:hypothetical protein
MGKTLKTKNIFCLTKNSRQSVKFSNKQCTKKWIQSSLSVTWLIQITFVPYRTLFTYMWETFVIGPYLLIYRLIWSVFKNVAHYLGYRILRFVRLCAIICYYLITEVAQIRATFFHGRLYAQILTKIGWPCFGLIFISLSGHPVC